MSSKTVLKNDPSQYLPKEKRDRILLDTLFNIDRTQISIVDSKLTPETTGIRFILFSTETNGKNFVKLGIVNSKNKNFVCFSFTFEIKLNPDLTTLENQIVSFKSGSKWINIIDMIIDFETREVRIYCNSNPIDVKIKFTGLDMSGKFYPFIYKSDSYDVEAEPYQVENENDKMIVEKLR